MNKEDVVGLLAGLCLMGLIIIGYPMAGFLTISIVFFIIYPLVGLWTIVEGAIDFRSTGRFSDFFQMLLGSMIITYGFLIWAYVLGWM